MVCCRIKPRDKIKQNYTFANSNYYDISKNIENHIAIRNQENKFK